MGPKIEVSALNDDSYRDGTTKPHRNEAYVSHWHDIGQVQVREGLTATCKAQQG